MVFIRVYVTIIILANANPFLVILYGVTIHLELWFCEAFRIHFLLCHRLRLHEASPCLKIEFEISIQWKLLKTRYSWRTLTGGVQAKLQLVWKYAPPLIFLSIPCPPPTCSAWLFDANAGVFKILVANLPQSIAHHLGSGVVCRLTHQLNPLWQSLSNVWTFPDLANNAIFALVIFTIKSVFWTGTIKAVSH